MPNCWLLDSVVDFKALPPQRPVPPGFPETLAMRKEAQPQIEGEARQDLDDCYWEVRYEAVQWLGEHGITEPLIPLLNDPDPDVRWNVVEQLKEHGFTYSQIEKFKENPDLGLLDQPLPPQRPVPPGFPETLAMGR